MLWPHEKVIERLLHCKHERMITSGKSLEFRRVFDLFLGRLDPKSLGESSVPLSLRTFRNTLELYGLSRDRIGGTCSTSPSLSDVSTWTCLIDGRTTWLILGTGRWSVTIERTRMFTSRES